MREGVTSRSKYPGDLEGLERAALSLKSDLRIQALLVFCHAGGDQGPSDSGSDSSGSWVLHRDECMAEWLPKPEWVLRSGSKASKDALREGMSWS
jgi:hypothetical protein